VQRLIDANRSSRDETLRLPGILFLPESIGELRHLKMLELDGAEVIALPDSIGKLTQLETLRLNGTQLTALPESICHLTHLKKLHVVNTPLTGLPQSIGQLVQLEQLYLSGTELTALPESIGQLTQLKELYLTGTPLGALPQWIDGLIQLQALNLASTRLTILPDSIDRLCQLKFLNLSGSLLTALPQSICQLSQLQELDLSGTRIKELPESIGRLTQLKRLYLGGTYLKRLPESITQLTQLEMFDLTGIGLKELPNGLNQLGKLERLMLHNNPLLELPVEIQGMLPRKILEYYFRTRTARRPLNEAKLILVGRGEVGKTSIVNRLVRKCFDPRETKTEGINIEPWELLLGGDTVRLNIWDFGGQEIMHATHQFFLTQRSLYILVLEGRSGNAEYDADYWLKLIGSFGGTSPVIIALNKIKMHGFNINRTALLHKYPNIKGFVETDCADGSGLDELERMIGFETDRLDGLRDSFPAAWFRIKDQLATMKRNYLTYDEYCDHCTQLGEPDAAAQADLATYLHRLGIALNYRGDPRLRDTHVLNPHWVTNGIYTILNSEKLRKSGGVLHLGDLAQLLSRDNYPSAMHRFLMDLMKKFDLCFTFPSNDIDYLIPELLDIQEPTATAEFDNQETLNFHYDYPILPEGLLPRFIVRTHSHSDGLPRWRRGVILNFEGCRALIKADPQEKRMHISILGPMASRRRLLALIRFEFEQIHRYFEDLKPIEMVPLPTHPGSAVPYSDLLTREASGRLKFDVVIQGNMVDLDAGELLEGVDLRRKRESSLRLFVSYSHKDESSREELETHLKILHRENVINSWSDRLIDPGERWKDKIDDNLERADIILLLISADFIASDYCYELEMKKALQLHGDGKAHVVPVIVQDCNWRSARFSNLQVLPKDGIAVTLWPNQAQAWRNVSEGIQKIAENIRSHQLL
jgi:internalin A